MGAQKQIHFRVPEGERQSWEASGLVQAPKQQDTNSPRAAVPPPLHAQ